MLRGFAEGGELHQAIDGIAEDQDCRFPQSAIYGDAYAVPAPPTKKKKANNLSPVAKGKKGLFSGNWGIKDPLDWGDEPMGARVFPSYLRGRDLQN